MHTSSIIAIGTANPAYRASQDYVMHFMSEALELDYRKARIFKSIFKRSGIDFRHSVLSDYEKKPGEFNFFPNDRSQAFPGTAVRMQIYQQAALPLALAAIHNCLNGFDGFGKEAITHLITISCTGMYAPGLDIEIINSLHLSVNIKRTCINFMGCYAAFNGIRAADAICRADPEAKVLIVSVELCTLHFQKDDSMDNLLSSSLFADGAAAMLIEANSKRPKQLCLNKFHCDIVPDTSQEMAWYIGNQGFNMVLTSYVPQAIEFGIGQFAQRLLDQGNFDLSNIDFFAIHPGGVKILQACEKALNISPEDNRYSYEVFRNHGNMSSATTIFVLKMIWEQLSSKDHGRNIFSCAFGPGLTLESMLLQIQHV